MAHAGCSVAPPPGLAVSSSHDVAASVLIEEAIDRVTVVGLIGVVRGVATMEKGVVVGCVTAVGPAMVVAGTSAVVAIDDSGEEEGAVLSIV